MTVNNKSKSRSDSSAAEDWRPSEQQENARALASLGGTEPLLQLIRRRRSEIIPIDAESRPDPSQHQPFI
jgi:hypothetical protein